MQIQLNQLPKQTIKDAKRKKTKTDGRRRQLPLPVQMLVRKIDRFHYRRQRHLFYCHRYEREREIIDERGQQ